jgi:hypothetical protein
VCVLRRAQPELFNKLAAAQEPKVGFCRFSIFDLAAPAVSLNVGRNCDWEMQALKTYEENHRFNRPKCRRNHDYEYMCGAAGHAQFFPHFSIEIMVLRWLNLLLLLLCR